ncbi:MAG: response regulator transcription factor [Nitriliruptorales bacterium]|nr:response regulator transcription factor [Nitriliruptorales bacterium]
MVDEQRAEREGGPLTRLVAPIVAMVRGERSSSDTESASDDEDTVPTATVLIVDDESDVRLTLRTVLRSSEQLEVVGEAADGHEAIDMTRELEPDIVLLDLMMPEMDGREAAPIIFREHPRTMIVILSALSATDEAETMIASGAFAYVEKSEMGPQLRDGVETLWRRFRRALEGEEVWAPRSATDAQRP